MLRDFRDFESTARLEADLCIVGAGAAGISLAREFIGKGVKVLLVESGGLDYEPDTQDLYAGPNIGLSYYDLDVTRLRYLGGSTNHWGGFCAPLLPIDFRQREWVAHSGWPIRREDLDPFYERAQTICQLGPFIYDTRVWEGFGEPVPEFDQERVSLSYWQRSPPTLFGEVYRDELANAPNVDVLLNANVTRIAANDDASRIEQLDISSLDGTRAEIRANVVVLACGGLENPRMLLVSNDIEPNGLGNRHDLVGRFFMEHLQVPCGVIATDNSYRLLDSFVYRWRLAPDWETEFLGGVGVADHVQESERLLNYSANLVQLPDDSDDGTQAALQIWRDVHQGRMPRDLGEKVWRTVRDIDDVAQAAYRRFIDGKNLIAPAPFVRLWTNGEQAPNPDSRVFLVEERDALGMQRIGLDWRTNEQDMRSIAETTKLVGAEIGRMGLGRLRLDDWLLDGSNAWTEDMQGGNHHMGTTRMADDPRAGVVDRNCRVHGIDNLYVAGSSVFPTGGFVNPTSTIIALTLRLADHLKERRFT